MVFEYEERTVPATCLRHERIMASDTDTSTHSRLRLHRGLG